MWILLRNAIYTCWVNTYVLPICRITMMRMRLHGIREVSIGRDSTFILLEKRLGHFINSHSFRALPPRVGKAPPNPKQSLISIWDCQVEHFGATRTKRDCTPTMMPSSDSEMRCPLQNNGKNYRILASGHGMGMDTKSWDRTEPPSFFLLRDATFVTEHWKEALVITGVLLLLSKTI